MRAFVEGEVSTTIVGPNRWRTTALLGVLVVVGEITKRFTVPVGYLTDLASVWRTTAWLVPRTGDYSPAAVAHDYLITDVLPTGALTSRQVDEVFREIMRSLGVPFARRWLMWAAVRWAALFNRARRASWWRDLPTLLTVTVPVIPFVLPGVVGVLVSQLLIWLASLPLPRRARPTSMRT